MAKPKLPWTENDIKKITGNTLDNNQLFLYLFNRIKTQSKKGTIVVKHCHNPFNQTIHAINITS